MPIQFWRNLWGGVKLCRHAKQNYAFSPILDIPYMNMANEFSNVEMLRHLGTTIVYGGSGYFRRQTNRQKIPLIKIIIGTIAESLLLFFFWKSGY